MLTISYEKFLDKVHGCWYGKCLGGAAGAPVEGIKKLLDIKDFTEVFNPDLPNDDLDLQLLWLDVLENKGTIINSCDLADAWIEKCWYPFSEYGYFMKNYMRGVKPPYSGIINNSFFKEGMGCPIRSEIWGLISAGNPELAAQYAYMDATLDHADNSVYAEQFLAVMESAAFECDNVEELIRIGMKYVPEDSKLSRCFKRVFELYAKDPTDWIAARTVVLNEFGHPDFTNVVQNLGIVVISLLYGGGDMRNTINISLRCGFDADCTCASAASVIGVIKGYKALGEEVGGLIKDYFVCGVDVHRPSDRISGLAEDTVKVALQTPNDQLTVTDLPEELQGLKRPENFTGFELEIATEEGLEAAKKSLKPLSWTVYGPFYDQLDQPIDKNYPSPHGEGCDLPDVVCMVNNEVFLDREYVDEKALDFAGMEPACVIDAYEDFIEIDSALTMEGQMCCYATAKVYAEKDMKAWVVIGNTDGFALWCNGKFYKSRDEIRLWTPYNNFELLDLKKGENVIVLKLLRRTEQLKFSFGFRRYNGNHWHRSKWHTDLEHMD